MIVKSLIVLLADPLTPFKLQVAVAFTPAYVKVAVPPVAATPPDVCVGAAVPEVPAVVTVYRFAPLKTC